MSDSVQQIKDRLNIVDVVGQYVKLQKAGRNYRACCPFHKERTPSFMVSPERGSYMCFGCGEKGDIFSFVEKMDGVDFKTALRQLGEKAGVEVVFSHTQERAPEQKAHDERLREACEEAAKFFETELAKHPDALEYLRKRAVTDETRATWRIGYAPASWEELSAHLHAHGYSDDEIVDAGLALRSEKNPSAGGGKIYDRFRGRIMFPINDNGGHVIAFTGRHFEDMPHRGFPSVNTEGNPLYTEAAKYVNSPETDLFKKSRVLYGFDHAKESMRKTDCTMLVEGQFDVILSHQAGLPFAVAVSGTALTEEHLAILGRMSKRLVLALDNDAAGLKAGLRSAAMAYAHGFDVKVPIVGTPGQTESDGVLGAQEKSREAYSTYGERDFSQRNDEIRRVGLPCKDPADLVAQDPVLWRHAVRDAKPAIEFFLEALHPHAKDERAYKKLVEQQVLPLIASMQSKIDQAHFIHVVAERLRVPDDAVRFEVERIVRQQAQSAQTYTPPVADTQAEKESAFGVAIELPSLERAAGMLLFHPQVTPELREGLNEVLDAARVADISARLAGESERLNFEFDALGLDAEFSARSLLTMIERATIDERIAQVCAELSVAVNLPDSARISELNKKLTELARKKHS